MLTILSTASLIGCNSNTAKNRIYWSSEADTNICYAVGNYISEIPLLEGEIIDTTFGTNSGTKYATVTLETEFKASLSLISYKTALEDNDFTLYALSDDYHQATKSVSIEYTLVIIYKAVDQSNKHYFLLQTYLYQDKLLSWPSETIKSVLKKDIPSIPANYFQVQTGTSGSTPYVIVYVYGLTEASEAAYAQILKNNSYLVRTSPTTGLYNAVNSVDLINLDFYYDTDYEVLAIQGYLLDKIYAWPTNDIINILGFDLPTYYDPAVTYLTGYMTLENSKSYYCIECDYAPSSCLLAYNALLTEDGWEKEGEEVELPSDWPLFLGDFARYTKGTHSIEVRYYDPSNPLLSGYNLFAPIMLIIIYY